MSSNVHLVSFASFYTLDARFDSIRLISDAQVKKSYEAKQIGIRISIVFRKKPYFCKKEIYINDHIINVHTNTELLTTGLVKLSGTKRYKATQVQS